MSEPTIIDALVLVADQINLLARVVNLHRMGDNDYAEICSADITDVVKARGGHPSADIRSGVVVDPEGLAKFSRASAKMDEYHDATHTK